MCKEVVQVFLRDSVVVCGAVGCYVLCVCGLQVLGFQLLIVELADTFYCVVVLEGCRFGEDVAARACGVPWF